MPFGPLVTPDWLAAHLGEPDLRVIDFRWYLDGRSGQEAYAKAHIPGAVFVDLAEVTGSEGPGRHPLPGRVRMEEAMRAAGVNAGSRVVAYDDAGGFSAARLWWLLRQHGHDAAAVLDGGLTAWTADLSDATETVAPGDFVAADIPAAAVVDRREVLDREPHRVLLDARLLARYTGAEEPIDPRAGHIPGARNAPWRDNLGTSMRFLPPESLRDRYAALGVGEGPDTIVYCGSGVTACVDLLALEVAGYSGARLYSGSWSDWSWQDELPVATGDQP